MDRESFACVFVDEVVTSSLPVFGGAFDAMACIVFGGSQCVELAQWRSLGPVAVSDLKRSIAQRITLSSLALGIAGRFSVISDDGLGDMIDLDEVGMGCPGATEASVLNACLELEQAGLIELFRAARGSGHAQSRLELFEAFDPVVRRCNPRVDAARIAQEIVAKPVNQAIQTAEIRESLRLSIRRFNPALMLISRTVRDTHQYGGGSGQEFIACITADGAERSVLRRFANRVLRPIEDVAYTDTPGEP